LLFILCHTEEHLQFSKADSLYLLLVDIFPVDRVLEAVHSFHFSKVYQARLSLVIETKQLLCFIHSDDVVDFFLGNGVKVYVSAVIKQAAWSLLIFSFRVKKA
jgi:hypothetical protein